MDTGAIIAAVVTVVLTALLTIAAAIHVRRIYNEVKEEVFDILDNHYVFKDAPMVDVDLGHADDEDDI